MAKVYAVCGDIGGTKEVIPAAAELMARGVSVEWFIDPNGKGGPDVLAKPEVLTKLGVTAKAYPEWGRAGVAYETREPNENDCPDLIMVGTSATAAYAQIKWTNFGKKHGIPVLWVEDLHGTGSRKALHDVWPDAMCVIDEAAQSIAQTVRRGLTTHVTGKPSFENLSDLISRKAEICTKVREELKLAETDFFVTWLFGGEPAARSNTQLDYFEDSLSEHTYPGVFNLRFHPKHPDSKSGLQHARFEKMNEIKKVDGRPIKDVQEVVLASDMLLADWGNTDALTALLGGVPVVTILFPEDTVRRVDAGYPEGVPPVLQMNPWWGVTSVGDMQDRIWRVYTDPKDYTAVTAHRAVPFQKLLEKGAAARIADVAMEMMKKN